MELPLPGRIAIVGLGVSGLVALKNLVEQGFEVVAFDRNDYIGGLWQFNVDVKQTTALKYYPAYPTSDQVATYLRAYASHFDLPPHFRLGTVVERIRPSLTTRGFEIRLRCASGSSTETFDKVIVASGPFGTPFFPKIEGLERFKGEILHSRAYKGPDDFTGQRVVVVVIGNTACDVAIDLCRTAKQVYLSHRSGARVMPRIHHGKPLDHSVTRRRVYLASFLSTLPSSLEDLLTRWLIDGEVRSMWPELKDEWHLLPAPPIAYSDGVVSDHLIPHLCDNSIISLDGIGRFTATGVVVGKLAIEMDVVIFCTGSNYDHSILDASIDPTKFSTPEWDASPNANGSDYPWLYKNLFSTIHPMCLAFLGPIYGPSASAFLNYDLGSQAIAQVWSGRFPLPSTESIDHTCREDYLYNLNLLTRGRLNHPTMDSVSFERWLNAAAGNGVNDMLGWGWRGWIWWWRNRRLWGLIVDGVNTPFVYRLFRGREGGRKVWDGAREAILKIGRSDPFEARS